MVATVLASLSVGGSTVVDQDRRFVSDMTLPQNTLGRTGLSVTKLGYGAMEVRGSRIWGGRPIEDGEAEAILNAVVDNGIPSLTQRTTMGAARSTSAVFCRTAGMSSYWPQSAAAR